MPELPEVETIARGLSPLVQDRRIADLEVLAPGSVHGDPQAFAQRLAGRSICSVGRRGKLLLFELSAGQVLAGHLKMTGKFLFFPPGTAELTSHARCIFHLDDASTLVFEDQRRFGYLRCMHSSGLSAWPFYARLGPEPLQMTEMEFVACLGSRRAAIKALLLDQTCIAGIGNIYADESLHLAGIHPQTQAERIPRTRLGFLHRCLRDVLTRAVHAGGSSFRDYVDGLGRPGSYQDTFMVYGRSGQPCRQCSTELARIRVAGRTTVVCPCCQPRDG
ncbi:bifunctional DNA-formamidopyrimidine glycosylase/DNA-(apurinic or apyrimidinic site) lyase [Desulfovermiculus halophilus]|uniref:bifunctional DNA-formamidopyrimidine glycosylase/DNA-(apurinic or apyrimidinic site) lyase n=1 Tax=Desulfovermiculus halophilus TaxID=339722 RepID=UPI00047F71FA|nr:bifunctional DNA-formamidopyrimidine glycosylase/DNA-(apurinic or apyrimidinic site) lyase [Desulfovermiculus halophilus]